MNHDPEQDWDAERYAREAAFVSRQAEDLTGWLAPQQGEDVLDLGCGEGRLAQVLTEQGACVTGVDSSPEMIRAARARGLDARVIAGEALAFREDFDAVFSNAALHWMPNASAVIRGVFRALRPGGRLVGELGGAGNIDSLLTAMAATFADHPEWGDFVHPWYFPTEHEYSGVLQQAGFVISHRESFRRPTPITSVRAWLEVFAGSVCAELTTEQREAFLAETEQRVAPRIHDPKHGWVADYVRLRFSARKP